MAYRLARPAGPADIATDAANAAAHLMGLGQPDLSKLLRGRTGGCSPERLLGFTRAPGSDVEITVKRNASEQRGRPTLRVHEPA